MNFSMTMLVLKILPRNLLSRIVGVLVSIKLPPPLGALAVRCFANYFKINMQEAELPLGSYPTIQALFTRKLKEGSRRIQGKLVHPCDSRISSHGPIQSGELLQAKGLTYRVSDLLGENGDRFTGGYFITYYLCPTDYHRVHSPTSWEVQNVRHIPGDLWPVNEASVRKVPKLFSINERVVATGVGSEHGGNLAMVMVGATNVGNIKVSFQAPTKLNVGQEFGIFHMGSTVILLLDASFKVESVESGPVLLGQALSREARRELPH